MPVSVQTFGTIAEANRALSAGRGAHYMGGGTTLMRAINEANPDVETLIRVTDPQLSQVRLEGSAVRIGAHVTMREIARSRELAFLAPVARVIGGPQVRSAATAAGNLFAEQPYGDFAGALLACGAQVELGDGRRTSVEDVLRSPPRSIVEAILVTPPADGLAFKKITRVKPKGVSLMSISAVVPRRGGRVDNPRIVFNGMADKPARSNGAERALAGHPLSAETIARAAAAAADGFTPRDDSHASGWYRREVAGVHLSRLLSELI